MPNNYVKESSVSVNDFIKEKEFKEFFMRDIDSLLDAYEYGKPEHKPDVLKQMDEISKKREQIIKQNNDKLEKYNNNNDKINEMTLMLEELLLENKTLKNKVAYLEEKITKIIKQQIEEKRKNQ